MPYAVRLVRIGPKVDPEGVTLQIRGVARDREALLEFLDNLIADSRFSVPRIANEDPPDEVGPVGHSFDFSVDYHPLNAEASP